LRIVQIVDFATPNRVARSDSRTPFSCLALTSFLHLDCDSGHFFFHFAIIILLWSHDVLFNNILKNTKHNEIQEKALQIQAGMCTEPKLTSN
jgi:hypothetical protein